MAEVETECPHCGAVAVWQEEPGGLGAVECAECGEEYEAGGGEGGEGT